MAIVLKNSLIEAGIIAFGTPTSPVAVPPPGAVGDVLTAWSWSPPRYRESFLAFISTVIARNPNRFPEYLEALPFLDWNTSRGVMPFWAEMFLGTPNISGAGSEPLIPSHLQPLVWEAWWSAKQSSVYQLTSLCSKMDPFDTSPASLSAQRARWLSASFMSPIDASVGDRSLVAFRDDLISKIFIPLTKTQEDLGATSFDNAMSGYLSGYLFPAWVSDRKENITPFWEAWMFDQSSILWPNFAHSSNPSDKKPGQPLLYGLPEAIVSYTVRRMINKKEVNELPAEDAELIATALRRSISHRGSMNGTVWLPSATLLLAKLPSTTSAYSQLACLMLSMESFGIDSSRYSNTTTPVRLKF